MTLRKKVVAGTEKKADAVERAKAHKSGSARPNELNMSVGADKTLEPKSMFRGGKYEWHMLLEVNRATARLANKQVVSGEETMPLQDKFKKASKSSLESLEKSLEKVKKDATKQAQEKASILAKELRP